MPNGYTIQYTGEPDTDTQALLDWLRARGYTDQQTDVLTRLSVTLPIRTPMEPGEEGIDVSRHNWPVDWPAVKAAGKRFAYIRASMGYPGAGFTGRDDRFENHWAAARAAGLMVGAYHYMIWNHDGLRQADNFYAVTGGDWGELPPVVDVEPRESDTPEVVDKAHSQAELTSFLNRLFTISGQVPVIYTSKNAWFRMTLEPTWLRNYLLWVADYTPPIQLPTHAVFAWMHQYTVAPSGSLPYHPGALDLNRYLGDRLPPPPTLPWWQATPLPFVAVARSLPLTTYSAAGGPVHDVRPGATYDLGVLERVILDGVGWLRVSPTLWCKADDLRLK